MTKNRLIAIILTLAVGYANLIAYAQVKQEDSGVIQLAREIAVAADSLMKMKQPEKISRIKASIIEDLTEYLGDATQRLREMGDSAGLELRKVLGEKRSYLTLCGVAYALYLFDPTEVEYAVEELLKQMNRMMFTDQMLAQNLIMTIGAPAVPTLTRHLSNSMVLYLLGAMGTEAKDAIPALKEVLGSNNVEVAVTLVKIGSPEDIAAAKPVLLNALSDTYNPYSKMAAISLGVLGPKARDAIPTLRKALKSNNLDLRLYVAIALADIGDFKFATNALANLVTNKELHERYAALNKLADLGAKAKAAVPALIKVLSDDTDKGYGDRALAAVALTKIDPKNTKVVAAIKEASKKTELRFYLKKQGVLPR